MTKTTPTPDVVDDDDKHYAAPLQSSHRDETMTKMTLPANGRDWPGTKKEL
jgi:hypothetical protein